MKWRVSYLEKKMHKGRWNFMKLKMAICSLVGQQRKLVDLTADE
jgi:hypothetical protein